LRGTREDWTVKKLHETYCLPDIALRDRIGKNDMSHVREKGQLNTGFWWETLFEGDHLEDPNVDGRITLKWRLNKWHWKGRELV
jgi:hypothetical protein